MTCAGCGKSLSFWSARPIAGRNYCGSCATGGLDSGGATNSGGATRGYTARSVGLGMLVVGLLGLLWAVTLDVTVPAGGSLAPNSYHRVSNLDLMSKKQSLLLLFGFFSIVGAILTTRGPRQS